jgi:DNA-binding MarR family transcriptional regulator
MKTIEPPINKAEYEEMAAFRYALRQFLRFSEEAAHAVGLPSQQHQALLAIQGFPGRDYVTVGELAERLQIRQNAAVGLVNRLVVEELAERHHPEKDRRQVHVTLTPRGTELLLRLAAVHREELQRIGPELYRQLKRLIDLHGSITLP